MIAITQHGISALHLRPLLVLVTPESLIHVLNIDHAQYEELLDRGLPVIRFRDGEVRPPVTAVDEWLSRSSVPSGDDSVWTTELKRIADHFDQPRRTLWARSTSPHASAAR